MKIQLAKESTEKSTVAVVDTPVVDLPSWTTPAAVTTYITSLALTVISALTMTGVIVPSNTSTEVQTWVGIVGFVVAGAVQAVNAFTHRAAAAQIAVAQITNGH
jgi:hypothetical protein